MWEEVAVSYLKENPGIPLEVLKEGSVSDSRVGDAVESDI
jgi:hypothetical protein